MRLGFRPASPGVAAALAVVLAAPVVLAGCSAEVNVGGSSDASGEELAAEIGDDYAERTGIELRRLTCEGVEADKGARFRCSGRNARSVQLEIAGRVTETGAGGFDYSWRVAAAIAPGVLYERALRRQLEAGGVAISAVRCPVEVEVETGRALRCRVTDANGSSRWVRLRLTDLDGGFDYAVEGDAEPAAGSAPS